jgi:acyl-CoA hydrolase
MQWKQLLKLPKWRIAINWRKSKKATQGTSKSTISHSLIFNMGSKVQVPSKDIIKIILLNPWSTVHSPEIINQADKIGALNTKVSFKVLSNMKGIEIENEIKAMISKESKHAEFIQIN